MNENELWQKFCNGGKVADYLNYRNCVNSKAAQNNITTEFDKSAENYGTGTCNKRTEYR
ncbi:MAG: hypothetical protein ACI4IF_01550 [Acutalibacteraceae bacterium]